MDAVEEIKSRLSIEDVIGEYVQLKRTGRNWKGLSPWTNERTPSFVVSPEKQIWHDFSSSKGGDMFSFVMEVEGLDFRQALELLAHKAGVELGQYRGSGDKTSVQQKERLFKALELATLFYQAQLKGNHAALEYLLKKRQFGKVAILEWRLGYAPNAGAALVKFLTSKGFNAREVQAAGLSARSYRGESRDMFRGRITVPLADAQGRIIGFTARLLANDPNAPKYINTPQTLLYDKSRHVFGLHLAKEAIRKNKFAVIAEGNLDVIMSHQAGVRQCVATAGTALTEQQLKALGRFTPDIRLSFDADRAGMSATERVIPLASKVGVTLSIIDIPSGKDPDELIRQDPKIWLQVIERPKYALDWLLERYQASLDLSSAVGKRQFSDVLLPVVRQLTDSVEQAHYLNKIAALLDVSREALSTKLAQSAPHPSLRKPQQRRQFASQKLDRTAIEAAKAQNHLLAIVLQKPDFRTDVQLLSSGMFSDSRSQTLFERLKQSASPGRISGGPEEKPGVIVQDLSEYAKILALQYEELYQGLEPLELRYELARLREKIIKRYVEIEKQKLSAKFKVVDETEWLVMQQRDKRLNELLKQAELSIKREGKNG